MGYMEVYREWLDSEVFDAATKAELRSIAGDEKEIEDRFFTNLEFGTGGLRGIMGAGTNRMNLYTVRKATQGLANYILKETAENAAAAIAYDSRNMSREFAEEAALVMCGNGIRAYIFDELRPTPELSFAVRELGCTAGIVVTASHNPPEYNGYKVYWSDGGQAPYPRDEEIIAEVNRVEDFAAIRTADKAAAVEAGLYNVIGEEIDRAYISALKKQSIDTEAGALTVVYTPLHGAGNKPVRRVLSEAGFNVLVVPEQELPDGNFPTVSYPNPEDAKAFELALKLAAEADADVAIATDPDCDRLGVAVKNNGEYVMLTGNMTGALLTEYILSNKKAARRLPPTTDTASETTDRRSNFPADKKSRLPAVISTIVSTRMTEAMAKAHGAAYFDVLTGFKYIGEKIKEFESDGSYEFLFGFEESYGSLAGTHARDKDAVVSALLVCELAAHYKARGMSLYDGLMELYAKYGYYKEGIRSVTLKGVDGLADIKRIMSRLRSSPPSRINDVEVTEARDYKSGVIKDASGAERETGLPIADVLYFVLNDGSWFCVRPSGTEPKIKIYFGVKASSQEQADADLASLTDGVLLHLDLYAG